MSKITPSLAALLAALTAARSPDDTDAAAGALYDAVRPAFIPVDQTMDA